MESASEVEESDGSDAPDQTLGAKSGKSVMSSRMQRAMQRGKPKEPAPKKGGRR